ncbi:hypothetical protein TWF173_005514 [Orbilia oligospora]|nr:hypothetical protein TWF173_005514 [Orbilia oligospora]
MDASEQERVFAPYLTPIFKANCTGPENFVPLQPLSKFWLSGMQLELTHTRVNPDAPVKGLLATSVSLSHKGRRAFQQAQSDGETFLQVVNELSKTKSYVFKLAGGFGVEDVLARQYQQDLRILCRETFPRLKDKGGGTLSAFEDLACEIETGIEAVARALGRISNSRDGVWSLATYIWGGRWKGVGGRKRYPKWCRFAQQEGLEKIEGIATLDSGKAGLNKQTQLALEQMAKYRCDAQEAIDELITNRKLQLWDQLKATGYKLSDASPLNPRRRAATDRAGENAREIFGDL